MVGLRKWLVNFSAVVGTTAAFSVFNNSAGRCGFAQTGYALAGFGRCWLVSFCGIRAAVYGHFDMAADGGVERASVRFTLRASQAWSPAAGQRSHSIFHAVGRITHYAAFN